MKYMYSPCGGCTLALIKLLITPILFAFNVSVWDSMRQVLYTACATPSASPELTALPVFLIFSRTVA